jgi:hypothetical protein
MGIVDAASSGLIVPLVAKMHKEERESTVDARKTMSFDCAHKDRLHA